MSLGGLAAVDVAIGLVALFFLLSVVCSAINESIANVLGWRAKTLEDAIRSLVGEPQGRQIARAWLTGGWRRIGRVEPRRDRSDVTTTLFEHWRISGLVRNPKSRWRRRARPSYLPPRAFSLALAETLARGAERDAAVTDKSPWQLADDEILKRVTDIVDELPDGQLRRLVEKAAINAHGSLEGFRNQVEHVFDDSMERASGWYKRKVQAVLVVLALTTAVGLNVDTVRVATALWNDETLRSAVAARAAARGTPDTAAAAVDAISELKLPVGWGANAPDNILVAIPGWLVTVAALNLGAPFWFDVLSRLARLRGSGAPEQPRSLADTGGTGEAERGPRA